MNLSDYARQQMQLAAFNNIPVTFPGTYYLALFLSSINDTSTGSSSGEVSGANYARLPISNDGFTWSVSSGTASNLIAFLSNPPSGPWGTVIYAMLTDAPTGGNSWWWGPLQSPVSPTTGFPFAVPIGDFTTNLA